MNGIKWRYGSNFFSIIQASQYYDTGYCNTYPFLCFADGGQVGPDEGWDELQGEALELPPLAPVELK